MIRSLRGWRRTNLGILPAETESSHDGKKRLELFSCIAEAYAGHSLSCRERRRGRLAVNKSASSQPYAALVPAAPLSARHSTTFTELHSNSHGPIIAWSRLSSLLTCLSQLSRRYWVPPRPWQPHHRPTRYEKCISSSLSRLTGFRTASSLLSLETKTQLLDYS